MSLSLSFFLSSGSSPGLVSYVSPKHRFKKFTVTCAGRGGPHYRQRFTIVRSVTPDPYTGAFSVTGRATPDNSDNYDTPKPRPYPGKPMLRLTGSLYVERDQMLVRGVYTLSGPALHCAREIVHGY